MGPEVHDRGPAAGHRHAIRPELVDGGTGSVLLADMDALDLALAGDLRNPARGQNAYARVPRRIGQRSACLFAGIEHGGHLEPRLLERKRRPVAVVIVGDHDSAFARRDAPIHDIVAHCGCKHDTGKIIPGKGQRTFDRPRGGDDLRGAHFPQAMSGQAGVRRMVG